MFRLIILRIDEGAESNGTRTEYQTLLSTGDYNLPAADHYNCSLCNLLFRHIFEGVVCSKVPGRKDIGHEHQSFIFNVFGSFHGSGIG